MKIQGVLLTAKLLNASAAAAANPLVNTTVSKLSFGQSATLSASDQFFGLPKAKAVVVTPTATNAALPLSTLGGACGAGVASCLHGCCSQVGVCDLSAAACGALCQVHSFFRVYLFVGAAKKGGLKRKEEEEEEAFLFSPSPLSLSHRRTQISSFCLHPQT